MITCDYFITFFIILFDKLYIGITDNVAPVNFESFECLRLLLKTQKGKINISLTAILSSLIQPLLTLMGGEATGSNKRKQREACRCLLRLSKVNQNRLYGLDLILPFLSNNEIPLRPRLALLKILLNEYQFNTPQLKLHTALSVSLPGLQSPDNKTRKSAISVVVICYELGGKRVLKHLNGLKPATLKVIYTKFIASDQERGVDNGIQELAKSSGLLTSPPSPSRRLPKSKSELAPLRTKPLAPISSSTSSNNNNQDKDEERPLNRSSSSSQQLLHPFPDLQEEEVKDDDESLSSLVSRPPLQDMPQFENQVQNDDKKTIMKTPQVAFDNSLQGGYGNGGNSFNDSFTSIDESLLDDILNDTQVY